ncbi:MAG: hypothetical protein ABIH53_03900, partial [archaeon]
MQKKFVLKTIKKIAALSTGVAMLGATLTGAMALDLKDYPSPFVADGVYDDANAFVVGKDAMAADTLAALDIAANLQYMSKTAVTGTGSTVTVTGGSTEKVALGKGLSNTTFFDTALDDTDISSLFDGKITFGTSSYDTSEAFEMSDQLDPAVETSLTRSQDDFKSDVFLTTSRNKLVYKYKFDKTINISLASTTNPIVIDFLGKKLKITGVTDADTFDAYVGDEHYMKVGTSVTVEGKEVKLTSVSTTKAVVEVDGVTNAVTSGSSQTINGIQVTVDAVFSRDKLEESSATLILGTVSSKTYNNGDAYVGEDENDPDWVWSIAGLLTAGTAQTLGVKNDFQKLSSSSKPKGVGECYTFPNEYLEVCLDSLTVVDADMGEYTLEVEQNLDLTDTIGSTFNNVDVLYLHTAVSDGIELRYTDYVNTNNQSIRNYTTTQKTNQIWISTLDLGAINTTAGTTGMVSVFFKDSESKVKYFGSVIEGTPNATDHNFILARINNGNTKDDNILLDYVNGSNSSYLNLRFDINGDATTDLDNSADDITTVWGMTSGQIHHSGTSVSTGDQSEAVLWGAGNVAIGAKDEDHRTRYGVIIKDPKGNTASERIALSIPPDQVFANVVIKGKASTVSSGSGSFVPTKVAVVSKTHDEVTSPSDYNLILVGGPCANPLVETVFGLTCDGWT